MTAKLPKPASAFIEGPAVETVPPDLCAREVLGCMGMAVETAGGEESREVGQATNQPSHRHRDGCNQSGELA